MYHKSHSWYVSSGFWEQKLQSISSKTHDCCFCSWNCTYFYHLPIMRPSRNPAYSTQVWYYAPSKISKWLNIWLKNSYGLTNFRLKIDFRWLYHIETTPDYAINNSVFVIKIGHSHVLQKRIPVPILPLLCGVLLYPTQQVGASTLMTFEWFCLITIGVILWYRS